MQKQASQADSMKRGQTFINQQIQQDLLDKANKSVAVINEKTQRCDFFKNGKYGKIDSCYTSNTPKEELVLEHVIQFKRQFQLTYDEQREILLYPNNECGIYKFICTTLRPIKLGYLELYNYIECAKYIAKFIQYEQLEFPTKFPEIIPSPANVVTWQKGDCFDMSIVLASLLIGVGYDAYCVYGIAPREVTCKNESQMENPFLHMGELPKTIKKIDEYEEFSKMNEFAIQPKKEAISVFDQTQINKKLEEEELKKIQANTINDDEPDEIKSDEYEGKRIHCWVLVKRGKRGIEKDFFIEPSTGRKYEMNYHPYLKVDAVFNHQNFWVHLNYPYAPINEVNFDSMMPFATSQNASQQDIHYPQESQQQSQQQQQQLLQQGTVGGGAISGGLGGSGDTKQQQQQLQSEIGAGVGTGGVGSGGHEWEYVMLIPGDYTQDGEDQEKEEDYSPGKGGRASMLDKESEDQDDFFRDEELGDLDIPPSWSPKPYIDKEQFLNLTPLGEDTAFYIKSKVDTYAPYSQDKDGMVRRIYLYEDYKRLKIKEIREFYEHRPDKLEIRRRFPYEFKTIEDYKPGNKNHWKQIIDHQSRSRTITFYNTRIKDGLIMRKEIIGEKTIEYYENRDDRVIYRSIKFCREEPVSKDTIEDFHVGTVNLKKMVQKFQKHDLAPANEQIQRMIVDLVKGEVVVFHHLNQGEIQPIIRKFPRTSMYGIGAGKNSDQQQSGSGSGSGGQGGGSVSSENKKIDELLASQECQKMLQYEKDFVTYIKGAELQAQQEEKSRRDYKEHPFQLEETLYTLASKKSKYAKSSKDDDASKNAAESDFLYPFLEKRGLADKKLLTKQEAQDVRNDVMAKLKERLLSRVEIIQKRLQEERALLEQEQLKLTKKGDQKDEEKSNLEINKLNFKISILEERATRFEVLAFQKFAEMDKKLNEDHRLEILHRKQ